MAYTDIINLYVGDTAPDVSFRLYDDAAGAGVDLTLLTNPVVTIRFQAIGEPLTAVDIVLTVTDAATGMVLLPWGVNLVGIAAGAYEGEVRIEAAGGFVRTVGTRLRFQLYEPGGPMAT